MLIFRAIIFFLVFTFIESKIYVFNTEDGYSVEFYDCIFAKSLTYCRRPPEPINLIRDNDIESCVKNNGELYSFSTLKSSNTTIRTVLHTWKSSIEKVERYSRYWRDSNEKSDGYLCKCIDPQSFGKNCEYTLPAGITFEEAFNWQLAMKFKEPWNMQRYGHIIYYKNLECNAGLLRLDWRDICDGIQQCMFGLDEQNCDLLELNMCDDDEYRCTNGMCIPDEYFLDGEFDCLDWSDEIQLKSNENCTFEAASVKCDDRICPPNQWSCGDGQCIQNRFGFQRSQENVECRSLREQYFLCETHATTIRWTMSNGRCYYNQQYEQSPIVNLTGDNLCQYYIKCTLSHGGEKNCLCHRNPTECSKRLDQVCPPTSIQYPQGGVMAPYLFFLYNRTRNWLKYWPDMILINGTVQCRGILTSITKKIPSDLDWTVSRIIEEIICREGEQIYLSESNRDIQHCHLRDDAFNLCNESNACMSSTRIKDGFNNCINKKDENNEANIEKSCAHVQRHRLRCSMDEPMCLSVMTLGNKQYNCKNKHDELWFGTRRKLSELNCNDRWQDECSDLREYMNQSWSKIDKNETFSKSDIRFRSYCDTFWNLGWNEDENLAACKQWWVCDDDQWRCDTGQCIDKDWTNDKEWDCADASDEKEDFILMIQQSQQNNSIYDLDNQTVFVSHICNETHPLFCLPFNKSNNRTLCISHHQIGDNKVDCAGMIDERNIRLHCDGLSMLGYNYLCKSTNTCIPYWDHCRSHYRCPNPTDDEYWCSYQGDKSNYSDVTDFRCFNGTYVKLGRCNKTIECQLGEDEYMCNYNIIWESASFAYRQRKEFNKRNAKHTLRLPSFPRHVKTTKPDPDVTSNSSSLIDLWRNVSSSLYAYACNRGIGIRMVNNSIACFCPPQYYGNFCEYHNFRLLVLIHINFSHSIYTSNTDPNMVLKILILFLFENQTLMIEEFHVRPVSDAIKFEKKMRHLSYSHSSIFHRNRTERFTNRSNIIDYQPYSVRIEVYERNNDEQASLVAVWQYPIYFDYLPVFRLAKVIRLTKPDREQDPCSSNPCNKYQDCQQLMNNKSKYVCLCKSNYTGENCLTEDPLCKSGFCGPKALCKPNYRRLLHGNTLPYCICQFKWYGNRCDVEHDYCQPNSCLNNGTCFPASRPDHIFCLCTKDYQGPKCEWKLASIDLSLHENLDYKGATVQYFDIDFTSLDLALVDQRVYSKLPSKLIHMHEGKTVPEIVLVRLYSSDIETPPNLYLLSLNLYVKTVQGIAQISEENRCLDIQTFVQKPSPFQYHYICQNNHSLLCFRDDSYLCTCASNHTRVECFRYSEVLDQCSYCVSGGRCLQGSGSSSPGFLCLCPPCYSGRYCQFNSKSFAFLLDQLFYIDLTSTSKKTALYVLIAGSLIGFFLAMPSNLFSFITLIRRTCLRSGIGQYLLCMSVMNQIDLGLLAARLIHLAIKISSTHPPSTWDNLLCKLFHYLLTSFSRILYWFTSLIAIERVYTTLYLNGGWLKKPYIARRIITLSIVGIFVTGAYEIIFIKSFPSIISDDGAMCVSEFPAAHRSTWRVIHLFVSIFNSLVPLLINLCCTITISIVVVKKKMNTNATYRCKENDRSVRLNASQRFHFILNVLNENKELVIGPGLTLIPQLFSLPLFIVAFVLDCQNLETSWLRYLLMSSYLFSFAPQFISFWLYISPSSLYSKEWRNTKICKWIDTLFGRRPLSQAIALSTLSGTQDMSRCN